MKKIIFNIIFKRLPIFLKVFFYKTLGAKIGKNFVLGSNSYLICEPKDIVIGNNVVIKNNVEIKSKKIDIGNDTVIYESNTVTAYKSIKIGANCVIYNNVVIGGSQFYDSTFIMGNFVHIYPYCFINTSKPVILEDGVGVGGGTYIFTHGSWQNAYHGYPYSFGGVTIKKNAWLPWRVFVMPGITIGENATIGSDALVGKNIPDNSFAVGVPAKVIKTGKEYVKEMTIESKLELFYTILSEYKKQVKEFKNIDSELIRNDHIVLKFNSYEIIYSLIVNNNISDNTLYLTELETEIQLQANQIDLKNSIAKWPMDKEALEFVNFLTNYGIRINFINKYE